MANLTEEAKWGAEEENIYQLELEDFITGGEGGNDNEPHRILGNRTQYLKARQDAMLLDADEEMNTFREVSDALENVGGMKNLWIDGMMRIWDDGESGAVDNALMGYIYGIMTARYEYNVGGSVYSWERIVDNDSWLRLTHVGAIGYGYIMQSFDDNVLRHIQGGMVSTSFTYACSMDMDGYVQYSAYVDGVENVVAQQDIEYIGDGDARRVEVSIDWDAVSATSEQDFCIVSLHYQGKSEVAIPDGYIQFTKIQVEKNSKSTQFEHIDESIERIRQGRYYHKFSKIVSKPFSINRLYTIKHFPTRMRIVPQLTYSVNNANTLLLDGTDTEGISLYWNTDNADQIVLTNITCDSRLYK